MRLTIDHFEVLIAALLASSPGHFQLFNIVQEKQEDLGVKITRVMLPHRQTIDRPCANEGSSRLKETVLNHS